MGVDQQPSTPPSNSVLATAEQPAPAASGAAVGAALSVRGVSKVFPGTTALAGVDLTVAFGEVVGLCGGNGSGKSTLVKIISGFQTADEGVIEVGEQILDAQKINSMASHAAGVRVVHQDLAVFPDLTISENLMFGRGHPTGRTGRVLWREVNRRARDLCERFEIPADASTLLRDVPVAVRAQVAIARALQDVDPDQGVIILDEPTASLPVHEAEFLLEAIRRLAARGHAIIFISHRLSEVMAVTDSVTVLRDGRVAAQHATSKLTEGELIAAILGKSGASTATRGETRASGSTVLSVRGLSAGPLEDVSLELAPGEVVGIAGLLGSGRSELLRAIYGDLRKTAGEIVLNGEPADFARPDSAIRAGVIMVPEDRPSDGAFADMTVDDNIGISVLRGYWRGLGFRKGRMRADGSELRELFRVKSPSGDVPMMTLSGGNQQKAIVARWFRLNPTVLLLDEPTQGVDVGARVDIYAAVRRATDAGGAALVVVSDLEELAQVVDRALVLRNGRVSAHVNSEQLNAAHLNALVHGLNGGHDGH